MKASDELIDLGNHYLMPKKMLDKIVNKAVSVSLDKYQEYQDKATYLNTEEVARELNVSTKTVRGYINKSHPLGIKLIGTYLGGAWKVSRYELNNFLKQISTQ